MSRLQADHELGPLFNVLTKCQRKVEDEKRENRRIENAIAVVQLHTAEAEVALAKLSTVEDVRSRGYGPSVAAAKVRLEERALKLQARLASVLDENVRLRRQLSDAKDEVTAS
jgi:hypothetical protein